MRTAFRVVPGSFGRAAFVRVKFAIHLVVFKGRVAYASSVFYWKKTVFLVFSILRRLRLFFFFCAIEKYQLSVQSYIDLVSFSMASKEALSSMGSPEMKADMFSSGTTNQPPGLAEATADSEGVEAGAAPASEVSAIKGIRFIMVLFAVYSTSMLYGLDTTIVADVQGTVVEAFGDIEKLSWIGSGFPLGSIAIILTVGKAYGFFNMKWLYIFSVTVFEIGSVVCGAAPNMDVSVF